MSRIVNTYHFSLPAFDILGRVGSSSLLAVLTRDVADQYACYIAIVETDHLDYDAARERMAEKVAASGVKQTWKQALAYFPCIPEDQYRR